MYSKFPFSMENIPRQKSFACLSLKLGSILTALVVILYSVLALSQCFSAVLNVPSELGPAEPGCAFYGFIASLVLVHSVSFILSAVMLLGALRDKAVLVKPWVVWNSALLAGSVLVFVLYSTTNVIMQFDETTLFVYVAQFCSLLIRYYMLTTVASFHKQLTEDQSETERLRKLVDDAWYTEA